MVFKIALLFIVKGKTMSTIKLYDINPYDNEFSANTLSLSLFDRDKSLYELILDRTLFFPEAGGQSCDKGNIVIGNTLASVERVIIDKDDNITHIIHSPTILKPENLINTVVQGEINWEHRFYNMQQHGGEHIFSGIVNKKYGYENVGFHLSDNIVTMDYSGYLTPEQVSEIEFETNKIIYENKDIICYYPNADELKNIDYRCKTELKGDIRIVEIKDVDICACCCPHVRKTGEIGVLKVLSSIRYKGGVRLSIICGFRALKYFNTLLNQSDSLRALLSSEQSEIINNVASLKSERDDLKVKLREVNKNLLIAEVDKLPSDTPAIIFTEEIDAKSQREALNYLINKRSNYCAILTGNDKKGYSYLIGSNSLDTVSIQTKLKEIFNAKGGGKKEMIQGFAEASKAELKALLNTFPFI